MGRVNESNCIRQSWKKITTRYGQVLQLGPKAVNNRSLTAAIGELSQPIFTLPRAFYYKKILLKNISSIFMVLIKIIIVKITCFSSLVLLHQFFRKRI
ncbi:PDDEXK family nuclease [secondary endosymbiont of Heteropsylla cubana]|uniref:hypothetical protein n=1 Tax=secondary endosymbiont of Heteropsylla cubana TaxID=134287 RepID=UPI003898FEF1